MISDVVALGIALLALVLAAAPASARHTYGLVRAEVIGALANAFLLLAASVWIVVEAIRRLDGTNGHPDGVAVIVVAGLGFVVNAGSAWAVGRVGGSNLNLRSAFWHLAGDALASAGALFAGIGIVVLDAQWPDPVVSILIVAVIAASAVGLVREATRVLLEGAPAGMDVATVEDAIATSPGVEAVHHVHLWSLGSETVALSAHVVLAGEPTLHEAQLGGDRLKSMLSQRFGIAHATLELECHDCDEPPTRDPR